MLMASTAVEAEPQSPDKATSPTQKPQIKVNILNVCTPPEAEKQEISSALDKVPVKANFSSDFEVTRGRTSSVEMGPARYIRLRRELTADPIFNTVQYSLSSDRQNTQEVLVFKTKEAKDLLLISIEDEISSSAALPRAALDIDTPATHVRLERFGKSSLALAKCENADQSAYQPIFEKASKLIAGYRKSLGLRSMFRNELIWLDQKPQNTAKPAKKPSKRD